MPRAKERSAQPCGRSCQQNVVVLTSASKQFAATLERVLDRKNFDGHCVRKDNEGVNRSYAVEYMRPRATVLAFVPRAEGCDRSKGAFCGFGLGFTKTVEGVGTVFYIDLVCSQERKGKQILSALEGHAATKKIADVVALRAAAPGLVRVYRRLGYVRAANACLPPSRAARALLRAVDENAAGVAGSPGGVYTDGTRVVSSVADAWRAIGEKNPRAKTLPPGWYFEHGDHGWYMSKCLR